MVLQVQGTDTRWSFWVLLRMMDLMLDTLAE